MDVTIDAKDPSFWEGSHGLVGVYPSGSMLGRDGVTLYEDPDQFGQAWQVLPTDPVLLTQDDENRVQYPDQCRMPDPKAKVGRRLGESSIQKEAAEAACEHVLDEIEFQHCVFDVMATNDLDLAGAY